MHDLVNRLLPEAIFQDQRLSRTARLVYFGMRAFPKTDIRGYSKVLTMPYQTVQGAIQQLQELDWAYSYRDPVRRKIIRVPWMPLDLEGRLADEFEMMLQTTKNRGERIMKGWLDVFVDDAHFYDNHHFKWAVSPDGKITYEWDRGYIRAMVVIEFQGRQHFETVTFRGKETDLQEQMARDRAKMLVCEREKHVYVEIADIDLSWETVHRKLNGVLPLLEPPKDRPLFRKLRLLSADYARWARKQRGNP